MAQSSQSLLRQGFGFLNRARLGFSKHVYVGAGGIGDDLMCSTVFRELRRRHVHGIVFTTRAPDLFQGNPDLDVVIPQKNSRFDRWLREGLEFTRLGYGHYHPETDKDDAPNEHVLAALCRVAGISGPIKLRPYLHLTPKERTAGRLAENQIIVQSSAQSATFAVRNKEWIPGRFQEVCDHLRSGNSLIQIGASQDPKLEGAVDLRGQTSLRQSAAILANALVFIGLEGLLMHLARAVDCRSVIIYGGRLRPWQIGYAGNSNLIGDTACSPCWLRSRCDYQHECMKMIEPEAVIRAVESQLAKKSETLEVEEFVI
ncbi:MAG TPA: glycosyltransferase family 9 protein [Chthoniobacter sp.]|jgi:ADP-heptose:LPS heptosyltransferase